MKFVRIESASVENVTNERVYDIELAKNHFFEANGIITHNCRLKNKINTREFNFTNGNIGIERIFGSLCA